MKNNRVEVEEYSLVPLNEPATASEVTYSIVEHPTLDHDHEPPLIDSSSISLGIDCQNESTPCEDHDMGEEHTVPQLETV